MMVLCKARWCFVKHHFGFENRQRVTRSFRRGLHHIKNDPPAAGPLRIKSGIQNSMEDILDCLPALIKWWQLYVNDITDCLVQLLSQAFLGHSRSAQIFSFALLTSVHVPLGVKVTLFETFHMCTLASSGSSVQVFAQLIEPFCLCNACAWTCVWVSCVCELCARTIADYSSLSPNTSPTLVSVQVDLEYTV